MSEAEKLQIISNPLGPEIVDQESVGLGGERIIACPSAGGGGVGLCRDTGRGC